MFGWGYSGAGPHLLYQALVHAMDGSVAPATDGRFIDEPSSFYRRLTARQHTPDVNDVVDEALVLQPDFVMSLVGCRRQVRPPVDHGRLCGLTLIGWWPRDPA